MHETINLMIQQAPKAVQPDGSLNLVIFDCDGVLVESEHLVSEVLGSEARYFGWHITDHVARETFEGVQLQNIKQIIEDHIAKSLPADWVTEVHAKVVKAMYGNVRQIEGVEQVLKTLQDLKIPYRVGSNSSHEEMEIKFNKTNLQKWFPDERIHSAYDVKRSKPFPDLYLYAAEQEHVSPEECLVIEDSNPGLKAAYDAGMACMLLRDLNKAAPDYPGILRMASLSEVAGFIKEVVIMQRNRGKTW